MRNREEKKCKKGQESTIGKIIYGFLLFMPLLAILTTCGYAMFNKNAYQSYSDTTLEQTIKYDNSTNLVEDNTYQVYVDTKITNSGSVIFYKDISINWADYSNNYVDRNYTGFNFYGNGTTKTILLYYEDTYWYSDITTDNIPNTFTITFDRKQNDNNYNGFYLVNYILTTSKLDNVFYYAIDKAEQSNLFNWAKNSVIYTTTNATCNALNINNTFIPLLLSYWLIISVLYFLYDIALMLVWIVHRKIHEMQENF